MRKVQPERLSDATLIPDDIQHVIHNLEGDACGHPVGMHGPDDGIAGPSELRSQLGRYGGQRPGRRAGSGDGRDTRRFGPGGSPVAS